MQTFPSKEWVKVIELMLVIDELPVSENARGFIFDMYKNMNPYAPANDELSFEQVRRINDLHYQNEGYLKRL